MADVDTNNGIVEVCPRDEFNENGNETQTVNEIHENINGHVGVDVSEEDILQQALVDESDAFPDEVQIQYTDASDGVQSLQEDGIITTGDNGVEFMSTDTAEADNEVQLTDTPVQLTGTFENGNFILSAAEESNQNVGEAVDSVLSVSDVASTDSTTLAYVTSTHQPTMANIVSVTNNAVEQDSITVQNSNPPLGSSLNPIRIIQQGNQYTPVQQLSTDQLQQIMQVVQQQQVTKTLDSGSSVLFNPQTNTRIVYRVIYPSDLHKDVVGSTSEPHELAFVTPKKTYKKKHKEDEAEKLDGPELSKEEKNQRKKMRPTTRSGRVSKPPKHMVKDFKHIHVLDYDEEYDDSDGGYSDYKVDENEEHVREKKPDDSVFGLSSVKPKNWKCVSCGKAYIGRAGLGRHLKLYPTHGTLDTDGDGEMVPPEHPPVDVTPPVNGNVDEDSSMSVPAEDTPTTDQTTFTDPTTPFTSNGLNSTASLSEDSRDSVASLTTTPQPRPRPRGHHRRGRPRGQRGHWRGRGAYTKLDQETRRKNKLKDITRESSDEELMEIVLPRLAKVITLWEFLLMKVERGDPAWPHADDIYMEYAKLHQHVKKLCQEYLQYVTDTDADKDPGLFKVESNPVSESLGLKSGAHKVKEIPDSDVDMVYKYKFLTTNHNMNNDYNNKSILKRTVAVVPQEQIVSPAKKPRPNKPLLPVSNNSQIVPNAVNITRPRPVIASANVLMNSFPQPPGILQASETVHILSPPGAATEGQLTSTGKSQGQRAISLLSNSLIKTPISSSLQTPKPASQKFIVVSGMAQNSAVDSQLMGVAAPGSNTGIRTFVPIAPNSSTIQPAVAGQTMVALTNNPTLTADQLLVSTNNLDAASTSRLTQKPPEQTQIIQPTSILPFTASTSQPVYLTIPSQAQTQTTILQPNLIDHTSVNETQQVVTSNGQYLVKFPAASDVSVYNNGDKVTGDTDSFIVVTSAGDESSNTCINALKEESPSVFTIQSSENGDLNSAINEAVSGEPNDTDEQIDGESVYSVDSAMLLVNDPTKPSALSNDSPAGPNHSIEHVIMDSSSTNDLVGVIDSIDTGQTQQVQVQMDQSQEGFEQVSLGDGDSDLTAAASVESEGQEGKHIVQLETDTGGGSDPGETLQIPATNIYQTEEGLVIIQNADGATFQLQGSDGQPISMETVQALMGLDGETQFITEQTEQVFKHE